MPDRWTLADVWMLRAIGGEDLASGVSLRQVIAAADYLNHAIPLEEEFVGAVGRLAGAGLVGFDVAADRYWRTPAGQASGAHRGAFAAGMAALPEPSAERRLVTLPAGVFASAVGRYLQGSG